MKLGYSKTILEPMFIFPLCTMKLTSTENILKEKKLNMRINFWNTLKGIYIKIKRTEYSRQIHPKRTKILG